MCLLLTSATATAQSITGGTLEGTVRDATGEPLRGASIWITDATTGTQHHAVADRSGRFRLQLLPPGDYSVRVEEIGYQPKRLVGVPVRPGTRRQLSVTLATAVLPVNQVQDTAFRQRADATLPGRSQWFTPIEVKDLPEARRDLTELARLSSASDPEFNTEGLPAWLSGIAVDGLPFEAARHPDLPPGQLSSSVFPLSEIESAELQLNAADVEWSEAAGAYLSGTSQRGTARQELRLLGDWQAGVLTSSAFFDGRGLGTHSLRGGAVLSSPIVRDTAHVIVGIEAQRLETPLPQPWEINTLDAALVGVAGSAYGVNIANYTRPRSATSDLLTGFGRFDWQVANDHRLSIRGSISSIQAGGDPGSDIDLGPGHLASLGAKLEGLDVATGATLASRFGAQIGQELRVGVERSDRDYTQAPLPATRIVDGGFGFGNDPTLPARFERMAIRFSETVHVATPRHHLKFGVSGLFTANEHRYSFGRAGEYAFGGVGEFERLEGTFGGATGPGAAAKFQNWQFAGYLQDVWTAAPGLDVLLGIRYEIERLDDGEVRLNEDWLERSGIDNTTFDNSITKLSPRFGFRWDISRRGIWLVNGAAGIYHDRVDPAILGELIAQDGPVTFQRGTGTLGSWPILPSLADAPLQGPRLTLLGPDFQPPRTSRLSLGVSNILAEGSALHISGSYRYTDQLPRRHDLNLPLAPTTRDQHGRPIYGNLVQEGSLVAAVPGSNRRFTDFDLVSSLDADGVSSYWGVTVAAERQGGDFLNFFASYTYSWTEDDWLYGSAGGPDLQLTPFPDSLNGSDWADGRSDYDVPHRLVVGAELNFRQLIQGTRLAAFYRIQSGRPFTPGFRDGVDVNGDGSARNDPGFIDETLLGMDRLLQNWGCLADQVGEFAERNSCREPSVSRLDARLALGLYELQGRPVEVVVDVLNIFDTDLGLRDHALLLIDRNGTLETGADGTVTLPLIANPNFGEPLIRRSTGRALRLGIRVGF